jgi:predicted deacetylase
VPENSRAKSLIVSLHDAHPGSHRAIAEQIEFLAGYGIIRASILVVPDFHHAGESASAADFCADLNRWQDLGNEMVLHGYFHDRRESPRENLPALFWTRLYTNREAEFLDLPREEARTRLQKGKAMLNRLGLRTAGFIAPAWLMAPGLEEMLGAEGFAYTTRLGEIVSLVPGRRASLYSQSLCYSTRAGWRRFASLAWNKQLFGKLRETNLIRLSLHPRDLEFPRIRRQVDQILRAALKRQFEPTTYGEYVAR